MLRDFAAIQRLTVEWLERFDAASTEAVVRRRLQHVEHCVRARETHFVRGAPGGSVWLMPVDSPAYCGKPGCGGAPDHLCGEVRTKRSPPADCTAPRPGVSEMPVVTAGW